MKTTILRKTSVHIIPLIIFVMLMLHGVNTFASTVQKNPANQSKSTYTIMLAKGQAYVPPQKHRDCA